MNDNEKPRVYHKDKRGRFTSEKRKKWLDNVVNSNTKKKCLNNISNDNIFKFYGRRVVELDTLAEDLWCKKCQSGLSLRFTESEVHHYLASTSQVRCEKCNTFYKVNTCRPNNFALGNLHYEVNGKAVIGKLKC